MNKSFLLILTLLLFSSTKAHAAAICCSPPEETAADSPCLPGLVLDAKTGRCETGVELAAEGPKCPKGYRIEKFQQALRGSVEWKGAHFRCVPDPMSRR